MGSADKAEESAIKYTKKLIEKRFDYYFENKTNLEDFFLTDKFLFFSDKYISINEYFKILFQISSNVPRIIGKVLEIALQKTNNLEKKITKKILEESARQHYKDDIEYVLSKTEYIQYKTYDESFEQYHLLQLLNSIVEKAIENKKKIGISDAKIFEQYTTNTAPSNYLFISNELENILKTLEFNFFITKFSQQKDKDNSDISVYTLNYGLCMDKNIIVDEKSDRKFRIERVFDANQLIRKWMNDSKVLVCKNCNSKFPIEQKDVFIKFKIPCTNCSNGLVELKPLINSEDKKRLESNLKITQKEFDILNSLNNKSLQTAKELASELDITYQSVSSNMNRLIKTYKFIERHQVTSKKVNFSITNDGKLYLDGKYKKTNL
jgi:predicted transcriptional regulator